MKRLLWIKIAILYFLSSSMAIAQDWNVVWGDLHTHSSLSDGKGLPTEVYDYASRQCDFLALTDHNHMMNAEKIDTVILASNVSYSNFIPLYGQEFSTIKGGNHLNVFNIAEVIPGAMNSDYKKLYFEWLPDYQARHPNEIILCQFNHPKDKKKDYGISKAGISKNYANDWNAFVEGADKWVRLIAILNGPGTHKQGQHDIHADIKNQDIKTWFYYLDKGLHLSPTCNHDTHVNSWGDLTTARTGVWIKDDYNRNNLLSALKEGHCFASEDKNLSIWFEINNHQMGDHLADMGNAELNIKVVIKDKDEPSSKYQIEIYRDYIKDNKQAQKVIEADADNDQIYSTTIHHQGGKYELYLVHVAQKDERDDVDDLWTAPIYIGPGSSESDDDTTEVSGQSISPGNGNILLVGSINSNIYHFPTCRSVKTIKPENLCKYSKAPKDKKLHVGCPAE